MYNHMVGRTASVISPFYSLLPDPTPQLSPPGLQLVVVLSSALRIKNQTPQPWVVRRVRFQSQPSAPVCRNPHRSTRDKSRNIASAFSLSALFSGGSTSHLVLRLNVSSRVPQNTADIYIYLIQHFLVLDSRVFVCNLERNVFNWFSSYG